MQLSCKLPETVQEILCCPICKHHLRPIEAGFNCTNTDCSASFPKVDSVPILLNENSSIFVIQDFVAQKATKMLLPENTFRATISKLIPNIDKNLKAELNYAKFVQLLLDNSTKPRVLVVGCGNLGQGTQSLMQSSLELVETDVSLGDRTMIICDAHDLPFSENVFDGVIIQAVLEHNWN